MIASGRTGPEFNVTALAAALHMAPSTLRRRCQAECGDSPQALLRQHRLERARQLLEDGAGTVTEVAYGVGYSNLAAFSRAYRAHFGDSPGRHLDTASLVR